MKRYRILYVEDDMLLAQSLTNSLEWEGYAVETVATYPKALQTILNSEHDLYLIDVVLQGGSGFDLCRDIRSLTDTPIIFLTGANEEPQMVYGLEIGADDYIVKPFRLKVLLARIQAVLRRHNGGCKASQQVLSGRLEIDFEQNRVQLEGKELLLTRTQFDILKLLIDNAGLIVPREKFLRCLWENQGMFVNDNTLNVHISNLKTRLAGEGVHIETIRSVGYRWCQEVKRIQRG